MNARKDDETPDPEKLLDAAVEGLDATAATTDATDATDATDLKTVAQRLPEYEFLACIGRGGMGTVYKAVDQKLSRTVAIKVLARELAEDPAFAERFTREARALARLNHPHILSVYDFGERDGLYYIVTEFVDGMNLRQLMQMGKLSVPDALRLLPQICEALQFAHDHAIVHRDIKPENILLDQAGRARIADFGLAKLANLEKGSPTLTKSDQALGTPHYMAPEQLLHSDSVDHRADIYSLGVITYEMLTGSLPVGLFEKPSEAAKIDPSVDEAVMKSLESSPERRYQKVSEFQKDLGSPEASASSKPDVVVSADAKLCKLPIYGFLSVIVPVIVVAAYVIYVLVTNKPANPDSPSSSALAVVLSVLSWAALVSCSVCGFVAIHRIRRAAGQLRGLGLAVVAAWIMPVLAVDAAALGMGWGGRFVKPADMVTAVVLLALDVLVIYCAYRVHAGQVYGGRWRIQWRTEFSFFAWAMCIAVLDLMILIPVGVVREEAGAEWRLFLSAGVPICLFIASGLTLWWRWRVTFGRDAR